MILSCPNCETKYTLSESQLGLRGRTVRCAACKATWHAKIPEKPIDLSFSDVKKKERVEDLKEVKAKKLPLKYRAILEDKKRLKALAAQGMIWGGLAATLIIILVLGILLRVDIVRTFPSVAGAYAMVGMKTNGTHLDFGTYSGESAFKDGQFVVTVKAQIKNMSDKPTPVPPVRVKLYDATRQQFDSVLIPSNGLAVGPQATRTLVFDVADPKNLTSQLAIDFDLVAMKQMKKAGANLRITPVSDATIAPAAEAATQPDATPSDVTLSETVSSQPMPPLRSGLPRDAVPVQKEAAADRGARSGHS